MGCYLVEMVDMLSNMHAIIMICFSWIPFYLISRLEYGYTIFCHFL